MLFMVIEHFRDGDAVAVYRRFRARGRLAPDGLVYVDSWVDATMTRCFQIMSCDDVALLQQWIAAWSDLVRFEVVPILQSAAAAAAIAPLLDAPPAESRP